MLSAFHLTPFLSVDSGWSVRGGRQTLFISSIGPRCTALILDGICKTEKIFFLSDKNKEKRQNKDKTMHKLIFFCMQEITLSFLFENKHSFC